MTVTDGDRPKFTILQDVQLFTAFAATFKMLRYKNRCEVTGVRKILVTFPFYEEIFNEKPKFRLWLSDEMGRNSFKLELNRCLSPPLPANTHTHIHTRTITHTEK